MDKATKIAKQQDEALTKRFGYEICELTMLLDQLKTKGSVTHGWRHSCGHTDGTMFIHRGWMKVVAALEKDGIAVTETKKPVANSWATKAGGFWAESVYSIGPTFTAVV